MSKRYHWVWKCRHYRPVSL